MAADVGASASCSQRLVLLGASNLTIGLAGVLREASQRWGAPLEVLAAIGHGRSYGATSRVLFRRLEGILQCGLWDALDRSPRVETFALVTDIGNDLFYDVEVEQIVAWVAESLDRLQSIGARIVVTGLPVCNLDQLGATRYNLFRRTAFPRSRLGYDAVRRVALELDVRIARLAAERALAHVRPEASWYGFDPIHVRRAARAQVWRRVLGALDQRAPRGASIAPRLRDWLSLMPERRWLMGVEQRRAQPCWHHRDALALSLY